MASTLRQIPKGLFKDIFTAPRKEGTQKVGSDPEIGFKLAFCEKDRQLKVKVIGARQLPTNYGSSTVHGYLVKVTTFPQKEKFETKCVKESWPTINEEFSFTLNSTKNFDNYFKGMFVCFTVYAVLEEEKEDIITQPKNLLKRFLSFNENDMHFLRKNPERSTRRSQRNSLSSRRTVGAVTYNLDSKSFSQNLRDDVRSTPDIWRSIKEITTGMARQSREGKNGSIELTLQYAISEDGTNDMVEVSVTKYRCSIQTMQEHEKLGGQLYLKITAFESEDLLQKKKSDKFDPTISLKLESNTATLRARVNNYNLSHVKIIIRLLCKNFLGKKFLLGKIEIDSNSSFWKEIVSNPLTPITKMVSLD